MKTVIVNDTGAVLFDRVTVPSTLLARARGLIGLDQLSEDDAWWFKNCGAVHMFGMHFPIDVVFLSEDGFVLRIIENLKPFGIAGSWTARNTVEARAGASKSKGIHVGQRLSLRAIGL